MRPGPVEGWRVYAVREGYGRWIILVMLGSFLGIWTSLFLDSSASAPGLLAGALVGSTVMILVGGKRPYRCSDTACNTRIPAQDVVCPGCGVRVAGRVRSRREILDLEDEPDTP